MWTILAIAAFLAGQVYLFRSLQKLDLVLDKQENHPDREVLNLVFADPETAQAMTGLMEGFFRENPEVDIVLHTDSKVSEAVSRGRGDIGFCPEGQNSDLNRSPLPCLRGTQAVWKPALHSPCALSFLQYLWQASRNEMKSVV